MSALPANYVPGAKKLKCTGEQPKCSRCEKRGIECIYAPQKTMGRPRKRRLLSDEDGASTRTEDIIRRPADHLGVWALPSDVSFPDQENDGNWFEGRGFGSPLMPEITMNPWPELEPFASEPSNAEGVLPTQVPDLVGRYAH